MKFYIRYYPLTILALLLLTVCMAVYSMVDIGAVIFLLDQSYQGKKADLVQTVRYALHNAARVFHRKKYTGGFCCIIFDTVSEYRCGIRICGQYCSPGIYHGFY